MNRIRTFHRAWALALVVGLLFGIYPELDLKLAGLFYDATTKSLPLKLNTLAAIARDGAMWIAWGLALPAIVAAGREAGAAGPAAVDIRAARSFSCW